MQVLRPHCKPTEAECLEWGQQSVFFQALQTILIQTDVWEPLAYSMENDNMERRRENFIVSAYERKSYTILYLDSWYQIMGDIEIPFSLLFRIYSLNWFRFPIAVYMASV